MLSSNIYLLIAACCVIFIVSKVFQQYNVFLNFFCRPIAISLFVSSDIWKGKDAHIW